MSTVTPIIREEQEQEQRLREAFIKALDFSEAYAAIERAEKIIEDALKPIKKESSQ